MSALVEDLLLLARLDAGRLLAREPHPPGTDTVDDARARSGDHHWLLDLPKEPVAVQGDEHRRHQVLLYPSPVLALGHAPRLLAGSGTGVVVMVIGVPETAIR
jgi:hypothetical protein